MNVSNIAAMGDFWKVVREFNPEGIEREALAPFDIWLLGEPGSGRHTLARSILGPDPEANIGEVFRLFDMGERPDPLPPGVKPDLLVLTASLDRELADMGTQMSAIVSRYRVPSILVLTHSDSVQLTRDLRNKTYRAFSFISYIRTLFLDARDEADVQAKLIPTILDAAPNIRTPFSRRVPAARRTVADQIVSETSRVNAQFALVSNLPANLLFVGGVAGSLADFFVLTKNQVMMVLRLAAIHGRDISLSRQIIAELTPIIGNAFLWRSIARTAAGMFPSLVAAVPKASIAYAGTYTVGQAARFYFEHGQKPPRAVMKQFSAEGTQLYKRIVLRERQTPSTS